MGPETPEEAADFIAMDLQGDLRLKGSRIEVRVENGIASLSGIALSLSQAERAVARALATDGIRAAVNQVRIVKAVAPDATLRERVESTLHRHPAIDAKDVRVNVTEGHLTFSGAVGTWDEQELARDLAAAVPGIQGISGELEVTFEGVRDDRAIEAQVFHVLANDPLFDGLPVDIRVEEGVVRLSGEAGSSAERERMIRHAHVIGVLSVEADDLRVNPDLAMEAMSDKTPSDEEMLATFRDALAADPRVSASSIMARCENGILFLSGEVRTQGERVAAESTARGVAGVIRVVNHLVPAGGNDRYAATRP